MKPHYTNSWLVFSIILETIHVQILPMLQSLSQFLRKPPTELWKTRTHVFLYLKHAKNYGFTYNRNGSNSNATIPDYSDADRGQEKPSRKSISGYVFMFEVSSISWRSKHQSIVAQSTQLRRNSPTSIFLWEKQYGSGDYKLPFHKSIYLWKQNFWRTKEALFHFQIMISWRNVLSMWT